MSETFPKWVVQRYCDLMNKQEGEHVYSPSMFGEAFGPVTLVALRLIQTHEKEPVDPDVLAVREVLAAYWEAGENEAEKLRASEYRTGKRDKATDFQHALAAYRAGKEAR